MSIFVPLLELPEREINLLSCVVGHEVEVVRSYSGAGSLILSLQVNLMKRLLKSLILSVTD